MSATPVPKCPACNEQMRMDNGHNGAECRCGFEVDHDVVYVTHDRGRALTVADGRMTAPRSRGVAGICIAEIFGELVEHAWDQRSVKPSEVARLHPDPDISNRDYLRFEEKPVIEVIEP